MTWMLLDSAGNAIAGYGDEVAARAALRSLVQSEPDAVNDVVLAAYDDDGNLSGSLTFDELPAATVGVFGASVVITTSATSGLASGGSFRPVELLAVHRRATNTSAASLV